MTQTQEEIIKRIQSTAEKENWKKIPRRLQLQKQYPELTDLIMEADGGFELARAAIKEPGADYTYLLDGWMSKHKKEKLPSHPTDIYLSTVYTAIEHEHKEIIGFLLSKNYNLLNNRPEPKPTLIQEENLVEKVTRNRAKKSVTPRDPNTPPAYKPTKQLRGLKTQAEKIMQQYNWPTLNLTLLNHFGHTKFIQEVYAKGGLSQLRNEWGLPSPTEVDWSASRIPQKVELYDGTTRLSRWDEFTNILKKK
jgi:hypothetical protein